MNSYRAGEHVVTSERAILDSFIRTRHSSGCKDGTQLQQLLLVRLYVGFPGLSGGRPGGTCVQPSWDLAESTDGLEPVAIPEGRDRFCLKK